MKKENIGKILRFIKNKESKRIPQAWLDMEEKDKLIKILEDHPDDVQYRTNRNMPLGYSEIRKLPEDMHIVGSVFLGDSQIRKLPSKMYVTGDLFLNNSDVVKLPDDLYVGGMLSVNSCKELIEMPDKLTIGMNLQMGDNPKLLKIPNNLQIKGWANLAEEIRELPDNLRANDYLSIIDCKKIGNIPNNLNVGHFFIRGTPLAEKYTDEEIKEIVELKGGKINGKITR
jgi:hypothetical protein